MYHKYHDENYKTLEYVCGQKKHLREFDTLHISYQRPDGAVTSETISRWIKTVLTASGIDTSAYSAHSTRADSTSSALAQGCPIDVILIL